MATAARNLAAAAEIAQAEVEAYLAANQKKSLLRFLTCGSVDDGKSTLIGRLLYDSKMLFEDQLAALESDSKRVGTQGEGLDFALLVDGLAAEREQGITIDVAYRFFSTDKRKFIVADTPGHEQYTRNMVTGASTADLAVILIDARKGVLTQTRRHSYLANLLGIRNIVLAVNKMDLVGYDKAKFDAIVADYRAFASQAGIEDFVAIPMSGLNGDNVTARSGAMPWYEGASLLEHLETVPLASSAATIAPFRMAVQWVNRPHSGFRGFAGKIASGIVRPGDRIVVLPSGKTSTVERVVTFDGDLDFAVAGQSVTLTFADEIDCSRGNVVAAASVAPGLASHIDATLVWMAEEALVQGRSYWLKIGAQTLSATVGSVERTIDVDTMEQKEGRPLALNDVGRCGIDLDRAIAAVPYAEDRQLGGFVLIDKISHATVAAGMIRSLVPQAERPGADVADDEDRRIFWLVGPSAASRAAAAARAQQRLEALGRPGFVLDEASVRSGLSSDLGSGETDQAENVRRVREVARLMSRAGVHVLVTLDVPRGATWPGKTIETGEADERSADDWII